MFNFKRPLLSALCGAFLLSAPSALAVPIPLGSASATFNFTTGVSVVTGGGGLLYVDSNNGEAAGFASAGSLVNSSLLSGVAASTLQYGDAGLSLMSFEIPVESISFDYVTFGRSPVVVDYFGSGGVPVGEQILRAPGRRDRHHVGTETFASSDPIFAVVIEGAGTGSPYAFTNIDVTFNPTPEPSSIALLGTGVLGIAGVARRRLKV